jgi:hypothetical protein
MESLSISALLVQLYQPELLTTGPAAKVLSGTGSPLALLTTPAP